jgi:hypothetical protein
MLGAIALLGLAMPGAKAQETNEFKTPSNNINCALYEQALRCDVRESTAKPPPRPKDCELDWGHAFEMGVRGKAAPVCAGDAVGGNNEAVLGYGKSWERQGFRCNSEPTGLTCVNKDGRGWTLKKSEQRLF